MQEQGYCLTDDQISEAVKTKSERQVWNDKFENQMRVILETVSFSKK